MQPDMERAIDPRPLLPRGAAAPRAGTRRKGECGRSGSSSAWWLALELALALVAGYAITKVVRGKVAVVATGQAANAAPSPAGGVAHWVGEPAAGIRLTGGIPIMVHVIGLDAPGSQVLAEQSGACQTWSKAGIDALLSRRYPEYAALSAALPTPWLRVSLARALILHAFGGVFAGPGLGCDAGNARVTESAGLVVSLTDEGLVDAVDGFTASAPGHPLWLEFAQEMLADDVARPDGQASLVLTRALQARIGRPRPGDHDDQGTNIRVLAAMP